MANLLMTFNAPSLVSIIGLVVVLLLTALVLRSTSYTIASGSKGYSYIIHSDRLQGLYEDEDGTATVGHEESFSARSFTTIALLCAIISVLLSLSTGIWSSLEPEEALLLQRWLLFGGWTLILVQVWFLFLEPLSTYRFEIGLYASLSSIILVICTALILILQVKARATISVQVSIPIVQVIFGIVMAISSLLIPRRPAVYQGGKVVDAQYTSSALERLTFTWARSIFDLAKSRGLEYSDLPALDHSSRSCQLYNRFPTVKNTESFTKISLWRLLIRDHSRIIILQWTVTAVESFMMIVPQICLFQMLQLLQQRNNDDHVATSIWLYVVGLGISKMVHVGLETWVWWLSFALLAVPIRAQLSALVHTKSMKMKDIKSAQASQRKDSTCRTGHDADGAVDQTDEEIISRNLPSPTEDVAQDDADESESEAALEAKQGAINLIAVDTQRISDFCAFNSDLLGTFLKVTIAVAFLVQLIDWYAVLAGLAVPVIFQPLNSVSAKRYAAQQSKVMAARDSKSYIVTEALQGIRQIKFSAIEAQSQTVVLAARTRELDAQWRAYLWAIYLTFCWYAMPIFLGAAALAVYAWLNGGMTAAVAFTSLAVFTKLEYSLSVIPQVISELLDARVSIQRIQQHLESPEKQAGIYVGDRVVLEEAEISWPSDNENNDTFRLGNLNLQFPNGELSVIHGKTGTGKSLLLAALLGEANVISGRIVMPKPMSIAERHDSRASRDNWILPSSVAFVSQIPWLEDGSIKENILFGLPFDNMRYEKVLSACALIDDLRMLPDGDLTEIGASGINLSGGQRWRVTVARAVYSRARILVLDDVFSAVDAHVGRHILEHCLTGELAFGRTRILVTHHIELVSPYCRYLVQLGDDGSIMSAESREVNSPSDGPSGKPVSPLSTYIPDNVRINRDDESGAAAKKFIEEEKREKGRVSTTILVKYFRSSGLALWALTFAVFALVPVAILGRAWWVKLWTEDIKIQHRSIVEGDSSTHLIFYLGVYLGISLIVSVIVCIKIYMICAGSLRASKILFEEMTFKVLRAPLRWLDTVPLGRILNRLVSDFRLLDSQLAKDLQYFLTGFFSVATITIAGLFVTPFMIIPLVVLGLLCLYCINTYLHGARYLKRLESSAKSPVFELYGSALIGLATIRSSDKTEDYFRRMFERIDTYSVSTYYLWLTKQWMGFRMGIVGSLFAFCVAASVGLTRVDASLAGFALSFALDYSDAIINSIRHYSSIELDMNSTERIVEYTSIETEDRSGADPPASWPPEGRITVTDLEVGYAPDLPSVLKGVTFVIEPMSRIGVVGRTGSGKTSLTLALFRFLEAQRGQINIDGIDIAKLKLHELRSRLAIIPQDPVVFSGTLRSNLDPFNDGTDDELRDALKRVYLIDQEDSNGIRSPNQASPNGTASNQRNTNPFANLSTPISQSGLNLSQGQRQLLCLARAIVTQPKIIILDEATSAVDMATDALIQKSIREQFKNSTLLVIAHRLSTISDFDKVLVINEGRVVEFDEPRALMAKKGMFAGMVGDSGERAVLEEMILGGGAE